MAQTPLNAQGGTAATVFARMADSDLTRLDRLAARLRASRSAVVRELLSYALDAAERAEGREMVQVREMVTHESPAAIGLRGSVPAQRANCAESQRGDDSHDLQLRGPLYAGGSGSVT